VPDTVSLSTIGQPASAGGVAVGVGSAAVAVGTRVVETLVVGCAGVCVGVTGPQPASEANTTADSTFRPNVTEQLQHSRRAVDGPAFDPTNRPFGRFGHRSLGAGCRQ